MGRELAARRLGEKARGSARASGLLLGRLNSDQRHHQPATEPHRQDFVLDGQPPGFLEQVLYGLLAFWHRLPVSLFLGLGLLERLLMSVAAWVTKPSPTGHHPPEHYASLLLAPVLAMFLAMAMRSRSGAVR